MTICEQRWNAHDRSLYLDIHGWYDGSKDPYYFDAGVELKNLNLIGLGNFRIESYGEGTITTIPHFHVISEDNSIEFCVKLLVPEYFREEGDIIELNEIQKNELDEALRIDNTLSGSSWKWMKNYWDTKFDCGIRNSIIKNKQRIQQPDYTQLH